MPGILLRLMAHSAESTLSTAVSANQTRSTWRMAQVTERSQSFRRYCCYRNGSLSDKTGSSIPTDSFSSERLPHPNTLPLQGQRRSFFTKIRAIVSDILTNDDHVNPKNLLERRYVYLQLLALELRRLRLEQPVPSEDNGHQPTALSKDELYEKAVTLLDAKDLDEMSNDSLRTELQEALHPQVVEMFRAFAKVDRELNLYSPHFGSYQEDPFRTYDWNQVINILEEDLRDLSHKKGSVAMDDSSRTHFYTSKRKALETLLQFHASQEMKDDDDNVFGSHGASQKLSPDAMRTLYNYQSINMARAAKIRQAIGYSILTLPSAIPNAGRGVFVDGRAMAGSIVAFQPGYVWTKEHLLTDDPAIVEHFDDEQDDCHVSLRWDDHVVDSRQAPVTVLLGRNHAIGDVDVSTDNEPDTPGALFHNNPFALGHMVNHPSPDLNQRRPNSISTMLNFTERLLEQVTDCGGSVYVPNIYAKPPTWRTRIFHTADPVSMHGLALLARNDLRDQELVYDYRLQSETTPDWYSVADSGIMQDEQVVFFRSDWKNGKKE